MPDPNRRITIGFRHGSSLPLRVSEAALGALRSAMQGDGGGWHELESLDGAVLLDLEQVVYLRVESNEQRVGF